MSKKGGNSVIQKFKNIKAVKWVSDAITKDSVPGSTFNLMNSIIGAGILFLPGIIGRCGVVFGLLFLFMGACVNTYALTILYYGLTKARADGNRCFTLEQLADICYGKVFHYVIKFFIVLSIFGTLITYTIIIGQLVRDIINPFIADYYVIGEYDRIYINAIVLFVLWIVCLGEEMKGMRVISMVSISMVLIFFLMAVVLYVTGFTEPLMRGDIMWVPDFSDWKTFVNLFSVMGILTFAFRTASFEPMVAEFKEENVYMLEMTNVNTNLLVFLLYLVIALVGYFSFFEATEKNLIFSYTGSIVVPTIMRLLIFFELILTYPCGNFRLKITIDELIMVIVDAIKVFLAKRKAKKEGKEYVKPEKVVKKEKKILGIFTKRYFRYAGIVFGMHLVIYFFATLFPDSAKILEFVGSSVLIFLVFIFPTMFLFKLRKKLHIGIKIAVWASMLVIGVVFGIIPITIKVLTEVGVLEEPGHKHVVDLPTNTTHDMYFGYEPTILIY